MLQGIALLLMNDKTDKKCTESKFKKLLAELKKTANMYELVQIWSAQVTRNISINPAVRNFENNVTWIFSVIWAQKALYKKP